MVCQSGFYFVVCFAAFLCFARMWTANQPLFDIKQKCCLLYETCVLMRCGPEMAKMDYNLLSYTKNKYIRNQKIAHKLMRMLCALELLPIVWRFILSVENGV